MNALVHHTGTASYSQHSDDEPIHWWGIVIDAPDSFLPLITSIQSGTTVRVTDGSFKNQFGTAGYVILPQLDSNLGFTLVNQTPGKPSDIDP